MTGGGFGGCTITLVEASQVDELRSRLGQEYEAATGKKCASYVVVPSDGAGLL